MTYEEMVKRVAEREADLDKKTGTTPAQRAAAKIMARAKNVRS